MAVSLYNRRLLSDMHDGWWGNTDYHDDDDELGGACHVVDIPSTSLRLRLTASGTAPIQKYSALKQ